MDLNINFQSVTQTANKITESAGEFGDLLKKIEGINSELKAVWQGADADKYLKAVTEQSEVMKKLEVTINEIGAFLVKVSNAYQQAQQANVEAIK